MALLGSYAIVLPGSATFPLFFHGISVDPAQAEWTTARWLHPESMDRCMEDAMEMDAVCGMTVSRGEIAERSEYQGRTYYFCSPECKARFDKNPLQYSVRRVSSA